MSPSHLDHVDEILDVIARLRKTKFSFLEEEDVAQEAYLIAMKVIKKWDGVRSLEHFLMASLSRRLVSLSRAYYRNAAKRKTTDFVGLTDMPVTMPDTIASRDELDYILDRLPIGMRTDFLRWSQGVVLPPTRRDALIQRVQELSDEDR